MRPAQCSTGERGEAQQVLQEQRTFQPPPSPAPPQTGEASHTAESLSCTLGTPPALGKPSAPNSVQKGTKDIPTVDCPPQCTLNLARGKGHSIHPHPREPLLPQVPPTGSVPTCAMG
ncbi:hypothetical protein KIL84_002700 [Mauremys mutica]|uniref:Uncharacterized protein n=1 Tax=Mauremys mutica TaxID=74926 RepID=A0A9D4AMJ6_9SAUR|nr:hypothetical protein KIL84_002700 [Mauremys mutica]